MESSNLPSFMRRTSSTAGPLKPEREIRSPRAVRPFGEIASGEKGSAHAGRPGADSVVGPWRLPEAEALLEGEAPSEALFGGFADRLLAGAEGQGENDFKIPLARRTLVAVLTEATSGARAA